MWISLRVSQSKKNERNHSTHLGKTNGVEPSSPFCHHHHYKSTHSSFLPRWLILTQSVLYISLLSYCSIIKPSWVLLFFPLAQNTPSRTTPPVTFSIYTITSFLSILLWTRLQIDLFLYFDSFPQWACRLGTLLVANSWEAFNFHWENVTVP